MIKKFFSRQFLLFLATGGTAAAVNFCSRILYSLWLGFSSAVILAYMTGMVTAFFLARRFVFQGSQHSLRRSAFFFVLVNLLGMAQTWGLSMLLARIVLPDLGVTQHAELLAHGVGIMAPAFSSFIGHKYLTFKKAE